MATPIPTNRAGFSVDAIVGATGAETECSATDACVGLVTDSRVEVKGRLFVALSGDNFDGHRFVADALARGAWGVLVERELAGIDPQRLFRVPSTLAALGALAALHRLRWRGRVVTIGGSAGKTTTRAAISTLLEALHPGKIHSTLGNLNNLVGVPMTLLGLEPQHEVAVVELGTNQRGEVAQLANICHADVAVLTCIGLEHSAGLGDLAGVEAEERELFAAMRSPAQVIGYHDDARVLRLLSEQQNARAWSYGQDLGASHRIVERKALDLSRTRLRILRKLEDQAVELVTTTRLLGLPGALASTAAIAVADALYAQVDQFALESALDREVGEAGRLKLIERSDRALIVDDCYNANPISMRSSIAVAKELAASRRARLCLVIGDMLELGELSRREHAALVDDIDGAVLVVAIGQEMTALVEQARQRGQSVSHFATSEEAAPRVRDAIGPRDVVLVKGSRGVRLERIVDAVVGGGGLTP